MHPTEVTTEIETKKNSSTALPEIPTKRYFSTTEVSELCHIKPHVLRYWEQEFSQLQPHRRQGARRYYQYHDVLLVRHIRELLYEKGFTIYGARQQLILERKQRQQAQANKSTHPLTPIIHDLEKVIELLKS